MTNNKFKALVHYLVHQCRDDPMRLGSVRLNKALWFTDMLAYKVNGESVTGATYIKKPRGPVALTIEETLQDLQSEGMLEVRAPKRRYMPWEYVSLVDPNENGLNDDEKVIARDVLSILLGHTADEVIEMSHGEVWGTAQMGEELPLHATLVSCTGEITEEVMQWASSVAEERAEATV